VDELSMHLLTTPLLYRLLTFQASPQYTWIVGVVLAIEFTTVMVIHMVMDEFLLHAVTFGIEVYVIATRSYSEIDFPGNFRSVLQEKCSGYGSVWLL
jgi:dihydroceramidase